VYENGDVEEMSLDDVLEVLECSRVPFRESLMCMSHHVKLQEDKDFAIAMCNSSSSSSSSCSDITNKRKREVF
jgi:hypothetical protein